MSDSFLFCSIFSRIDDLSKSFFQFGGLENTKVSRHSEDVLSVLCFLCVPINLFSSGVVFLDTAL